MSNNQHFLWRNFSKKGKEIIEESNSRDLVSHDARMDVIATKPLSATKNQGFNSTNNVLYGLNEDDCIGLQLENRKRRRAINQVGLMDIEMGLDNSGLLTEDKTQGTVISGRDLTEPNTKVMAELVVQASRPQ